jgi:hypothetical protein
VNGDLLRQLADYGRFHEEEQERVDVASIANGSQREYASDVILGLSESESPGSGDVELTVLDFEAVNIGRSTDMDNKMLAGIAVAVAAAIALIVGLVLVNDGDSKVDVADEPFGTSGLSVTDAFFEAYNAGDVEAVDALFTPDVTIDWFGDVSRTDFEMITAFYAGQGTTLTPPDCNVIEEVPGESATVSCNFESLDSLIQAVSAPPIPTKFDMVVTPDGVSQLVYTYGSLDFSSGRGRDPFRRWEEQNHPEAETTFGDWLTIDEARQLGQLAAQHTEEWAAYLEANGCTYLDETC